MKSTRLEFHSSIPEIASHWFRLENSIADPSIQNSYMLLNAWYTCYLAGRRPAFISLWSDEACIGIYPFTVERKYGATIYNTLYNQSFSISKPIMQDGQEDYFFNELMRCLKKEKDRWDVIKFSSVYCFDKEEALLASAFAKHGMQVYTIREHTYVIGLNISFEQYCQDYLSKKTRENIRRLEKKLALKKNEIVSYVNYEALPHMRRFYEMENTGWKRDGGTSLLQLNDNLMYTETLINTSCLAGKFLMTFLEFDGLKIAGQFGYVEDGVYNGFRTAYDRDYAQLGPAVLLLAKTVRMLIEQFSEIKLLHCYPDPFGYKQKYAHDRCECNTHVLFSDSLKGRLLYKLYRRKMSRMAAVAPQRRV